MRKLLPIQVCRACLLLLLLSITTIRHGPISAASGTDTAGALLHKICLLLLCPGGAPGGHVHDKRAWVARLCEQELSHSHCHECLAPSKTPSR